MPLEAKQLLFRAIRQPTEWLPDARGRWRAIVAPPRGEVATHSVANTVPAGTVMPVGDAGQRHLLRCSDARVPYDLPASRSDQREKRRGRYGLTRRPAGRTASASFSRSSL